MIALDVETSGLDPNLCSILSIGALDTDEPSNQFYSECRVWSDRGIEAHISEESIAINGFSREEITASPGRDGKAASGATGEVKKSEAELVTDFIAWAQDRPQNLTIVGQNSSFDRDFVHAACKRAGIQFPFGHRVLDIHTMVWIHMMGQGSVPPTEHKHSRISLNFALRYCGLPEEQWPHNALTGAVAHAEVFARIAYTKNLLPEFSHLPLPWPPTT